MGELIDEQRFGALQSDFPPPVVREVVVSFLDSTPEIIERLVLAVAAEDHEDISSAAHRLKGGCLAVGAGALTELASELERLGKQRADGAALRAGGERVEGTWEATRIELDRRTR